MKKIVHIMHNSPFLVEFIPFINSNFNSKQHSFIIIGGADLTMIPNGENVTYYPKINWKVFAEIIKARKIIFHGLFNAAENVFYALNPWIFKKAYWTIWGGDLYEFINRDKKTTMKRKILYKCNDFIKGNMAGYITHIKGDYELAQKWFGAKGRYYNCFLYLSNIYKDVSSDMVEKNEIYIQIGNSADPSNMHKEILDKLLPLKDQNMKLFCPLSYGDNQYAQEVKIYGEALFGSKFVAMMEFIDYEEYSKFNSNIDIAIFAHHRQQAIGNITSLLGKGKTIYLRQAVTTTSMLDSMGIVYFNFEDLTKLEQITKEQSTKNIQRIKDCFTRQKLIDQWGEVFNA